MGIIVLEVKDIFNKIEKGGLLIFIFYFFNLVRKFKSK